MSLEIKPIPLEGSALSQAYISDYPRVREFYNAGAPDALDSYREVADRIRDDGPSSRWEHLIEVVRPEDVEVRDRVARLIEGRGLFVAAGQQAGLFVSPLFTLYKALTAARLARKLEESLRLPVMPLFSVASEDHDWAEVDHTHVVDIQNQLVRLSVGGPGGDDPGAPSPPVESVRLGSDVEDALTGLIQATPDSEFKADILQPLRAAYRPGQGFAAAFESVLSHLLRRWQILVVRTAHPYVKRASRGILWSEWEKRAESEARLLEQARVLSAAGFEPQVSVARGATNLFLEGRLGRDRVLYEGEVARLRRSSETMSGSELRATLEETPGAVSPGVLLRPVSEAAVFPVVAHVGGPGEIAYLSQSQVLFDLHGVPAPVVVARAAFRLVEAKVARVLEKYGLTASDMAGDLGPTIKRLLDEQTPPELRESLTELRRSLAEGIKRVEAAALAFDPGARSLFGSGKQAVFASVGSLESKLQARVREKNQVMEQQLEKAAVNLYPNGRAQERVLNPFPYLIRYGESLLDRIYEGVATPLD